MSEKQHATCMVQSDKYSRGVIRRPGGVINLTCISGPAVEASRRQFSLSLERELDDGNTTRPKHNYAITNQLLTYAVGGREGWVRRTSGLEIVIVSTACIEQ